MSYIRNNTLQTTGALQVRYYFYIWYIIIIIAYTIIIIYLFVRIILHNARFATLKIAIQTTKNMKIKISALQGHLNISKLQVCI